MQRRSSTGCAKSWPPAVFSRQTIPRRIALSAITLLICGDIDALAAASTRKLQNPRNECLQPIRELRNIVEYNRVKTPPDQDQRDIVLNELDKTLLVEAAAGTGKTTGMIGRMVNLLASGKCSIDALAAVTFTRKAAAELRARFQVELERASRSAETGHRKLLSEALSRIERCFIGTIHSFCARMLRERPVEAGVDLAFEEIDEAADQELRRLAWDEYVADLYATDSPDVGGVGGAWS